MTAPNGVKHAYVYDTLNRLRTLSVSNLQSQVLHSYAYSLKPSGHRYQVLEATAPSGPGRTTTYAYDDLYRLTGETVANDPNGQNGTIGYTLDKVGNRQSRSSSVASIPSTANTFNARDWLNTDTYDANGNTTIGHLPSAIGDHTAGTDVYDFENRLILRTRPDGTQVNLAYDADGNRIQKTLFDIGGNLTRATYYLVDTNNLTGYSQVLEEQTITYGGTTAVSSMRIYAYGSDLISQTTLAASGLPLTAYYAYDGHGSVRELTDEAGTFTDTYTYDAFGVLLSRTGTSDNAYLYCGEQWDADRGLYFNRARYLNPDSGRFWSMDTYEGENRAPASLHKYFYANANPVTYGDLSGNSIIDYMGLGLIEDVRS